MTQKVPNNVIQGNGFCDVILSTLFRAHGRKGVLPRERVLRGFF